MKTSPFGLESLWMQGDWVTRSVALLLLIMSVLSWYVIVTRSWRLIQYRKAAVAASSFWHASSFSEGLRCLVDDVQANPFHFLATAGQAAVDHHRHNQADLHGQLMLSDWLVSCLKGAIEEANERMQLGLPVLASIGSIAPFVGLFGTVWGIYHALISMAVAGQPGLDVIAGPVGESLVMTAFGLFVAVPAVLGYNSLSLGNRAVSTRLNRFAHDLHSYFITGSRVSRPEAADRPQTTAVVSS